MVSCLMGDSTALASAIVRCCLKEESTRQAKLLLAETKRNCQALEAETAEKCTRIKKEAEESADRTWKEVQARIRQLVDDQTGLRDLLISASGGSKSS